MDIETMRTSLKEKPFRQLRTIRTVMRARVYLSDNAYLIRGKRIADILVSTALICFLLSWIAPILFLLIRLSSKGPLFFIQTRIGLDGKAFSCIKFRTMRVCNEEETVQADEERITPIGRFLRATHIDELPQLLNVFLNQMSIVGPRPHMLSDDVMFSGMLPDYSIRQLVKPGITGLAQSAGYYGSIPDFFSISGRTRLDVFYVKHASFGLDVKIFFKTLQIVPAGWMKRSPANAD